LTRAAAALLLLSLVSACKRPADAGAQGDASLLSQVKSGLSDRERKIGSYSIAGVVEQDGQKATFEFDFRAPGRMKGTLLGEKSRTFSYDGERLFDLVRADKTLTTWELDVPPRQARDYLSQLFENFVPEGYRSPVVDLTHATVKRVSHPRAPEAVELASETKDEHGAGIRVAYIFRWPSLDLLERRLDTAETTATLAVDEEQCDERLKLCMPKKLTQHFGQALGAVTTLSRVELGAAIPAEAFTLELPEGFTGATKQLSGK
jgi:outer membrane lipoprotein-sorting protein